MRVMVNGSCSRPRAHRPGRSIRVPGVSRTSPRRLRTPSHGARSRPTDSVRDQRRGAIGTPTAFGDVAADRAQRTGWGLQCGRSSCAGPLRCRLSGAGRAGPAARGLSCGACRAGSAPNVCAEGPPGVFWACTAPRAGLLLTGVVAVGSHGWISRFQQPRLSPRASCRCPAAPNRCPAVPTSCHSGPSHLHCCCRRVVVRRCVRAFE